MSVQQDTVNIQQAAVERNVQQILAHIDFYDWRYGILFVSSLRSSLARNLNCGFAASRT